MRVPCALPGLVLAVGLIASGCGLGAATPDPPCAGSHEWPPSDLAALTLPPGVVAEPIGQTEIRVRNGSTQAWSFETAIWTDMPCVGFIAESLQRSLIGPGHHVTAQFDPHDPTVDTKIAVTVYPPDCDDTCDDPPVGFGWIDAVVPAPS